MSIEVANESALFWGNEKWVTTTACAERKKGTAIGKKRERGETRKTGDGNGSNGVDKDKEEGKTSCGKSDHGAHIWTERERRKKMRNMFANLHALLPHLPPKADKSSIVDEAVSHIKTLQQTLQKLQRQKLQNLQQPLITTAATEDDNLRRGPPSFATTTRQADHINHNYSDDMLMMMCNNNGSAANCSNDTDVAVFQTWTSANLVLNICGEEAQINICSPPGKNSGSMFTAVCYVLEKHNIEVLSAHVSSNSDRRLLMIQARNRPQQEKTGGCNDHVGAEIFKQAAAEMLSYLCSAPN